jgi:hypothetical protein
MKRDERQERREAEPTLTLEDLAQIVCEGNVEGELQKRVAAVIRTDPRFAQQFEQLEAMAAEIGAGDLWEGSSPSFNGWRATPDARLDGCHRMLWATRALQQGNFETASGPLGTLPVRKIGARSRTISAAPKSRSGASRTISAAPKSRSGAFWTISANRRNPPERSWTISANRRNPPERSGAPVSNPHNRDRRASEIVLLLEAAHLNVESMRGVGK